MAEIFEYALPCSLPHAPYPQPITCPWSSLVQHVSHTSLHTYPVFIRVDWLSMFYHTKSFLTVPYLYIVCLHCKLSLPSPRSSIEARCLRYLTDVSHPPRCPICSTVALPSIDVTFFQSKSDNHILSLQFIGFITSSVITSFNSTWHIGFN